jgi:hypothetical protein
MLKARQWTIVGNMFGGVPWYVEANNYIFNLIDIYIYIPANGCIGSRLGVLLCPGSYNVVKTALSRLAFPRFTKHIQNNVIQDSFLFN